MGLNKNLEWNGIWFIPFKILKHGMENRKIWNGKLKYMEWISKK
jgi:hypothetical protein